MREKLKVLNCELQQLIEVSGGFKYSATLIDTVFDFGYKHSINQIKLGLMNLIGKTPYSVSVT